MFIYFAIIFFSLVLSMFKLPKTVENIGLMIIAVFLCSGYMTGSDWYNYELYFTNPDYKDKLLKLEVGYVFLQTFFAKLGVDFWIFHIIIKFLVFFSIVRFVSWFKINIFLFLAFFIPETGLYLFIDCPFRNLISLGIALIGLKYLLDNKIFLFFLFSFLAVLFHYSALILLPIFFIYKRNLNVIFTIIIALVMYVVAFKVDFLMKSIYLPLTKIDPVIAESLKLYFNNTKYISDKIGLGVFIRFFIIIIFLLFKETIIAGDKKRQYIFNLSIFFLFFYPFGLTVKIFHRFSIFLMPFYIINIVYLLSSLKLKFNKLILFSFFVLLYFKQTYSLVTYDYKYVPYTNYFQYLYRNELPNIEYRESYNPKHTPYKKKNTED